MTLFARLRSARPSDRLPELRRFYVEGLGCHWLGGFDDHAGFSGLIVGAPDGSWQVEFVHDHARPAPPVPSDEHLLVFYVDDRVMLDTLVARMAMAGHVRVTPRNPYWTTHGATYADPDGYHVVIAVPHGA
ncbi:MAG: VOC family protein [Aquabacterium sp.]